MGPIGIDLLDDISLTMEPIGSIALILSWEQLFPLLSPPKRSAAWRTFTDHLTARAPGSLAIDYWRFRLQGHARGASTLA